jgi:SAM-dependent methyltransferase
LQQPECPIRDYIALALDYLNVEDPEQILNPIALDTFMDYWRVALPEANPLPFSVLEVACGSANDYRFLAANGLAARIAYTGLDISAKNIANARERFPETAFIAGSILQSNFQERGFDCVFAQDLLEHLSLPAMEFAVAEMARITRGELWLHLFRARAGGGHVVTPQPLYHCNTLDVQMIVAQLAAAGFDAQIIFIGPWLVEKFQLQGYYNPQSATILARRRK